jgi:hypothetical protein
MGSQDQWARPDSLRNWTMVLTEIDGRRTTDGPMVRYYRHYTHTLSLDAPIGYS